MYSEKVPREVIYQRELVKKDTSKIMQNGQKVSGTRCSS